MGSFLHGNCTFGLAGGNCAVRRGQRGINSAAKVQNFTDNLLDLIYLLFIQGGEVCFEVS